jgi:hypothetical protein
LGMIIGMNVFLHDKPLSNRYNADAFAATTNGFE